MVTLMYFGGLMFFEDGVDLTDTALRDDVTHEPTDRLTLDSMLFHTFIIMNLFNQINCRIIDADQINIFKTLSPLHHWIFWAILIFEFLVQHAMIYFSEVHLFSSILGCAPLTTSMHITAYCLGVTTLLINPAIKKIPLYYFHKVFDQVDLETEREDELLNKVMSESAIFIYKKAKEVNEKRKKRKEGNTTI